MTYDEYSTYMARWGWVAGTDVSGGYDFNQYVPVLVNTSIVEECHEKLVWIPPSPYIPGTPTIPATPTEYIFSKNKGWNTSARSVDPFLAGHAFVFSCNKENEGLLLGVGSSNQEGKPISAMAHALIADASGITLYEGGENVGKLTTSYSSESRIKIFHQYDGTVIYAVTTGTDTIIKESLVPITEQEPYIFGYIYSSDDTVLSSEYNLATVQYGSL